MSGIKPFNQSSWMKKIEYDNSIDYFFTQRKVVETSEYVDKSTLERKNKKETITHNFLAINFPILKEDYDIIKIEIWGDKGYIYEGEIKTSKGNCPNIMLKLNDDTEIFVKLTYYKNSDDFKIYIHFINVLKRYQKNQ